MRPVCIERFISELAFMAEDVDRNLKEQRGNARMITEAALSFDEEAMAWLTSLCQHVLLQSEQSPVWPLIYF